MELYENVTIAWCIVSSKVSAPPEILPHLFLRGPPPQKKKF